MARKTYQEGSLEYKGGTWTLRYRTRDGEGSWVKRREYLDCQNERDALRKQRQRMVEINAQNNGARARSVPTFSEFVTGLWRKTMENKKASKKPSTLYGYDSLLKVHLLPRFGKKRLDEISPSDLSELLAEKGEKYAARTVRNLYNLLKGVFQIAKELDLIESVPVRPKLHRPACPRTSKPRLTAEEIRRLFALVDERWQVMLVVLAVTSRRAGEILGFQWRDFSEREATLDVMRSVWRGRVVDVKTEASRVRLHVPDVVVEALRSHRINSEFRGAEDFIFCREDGQACDPDHLRRYVLYPALDRAGIRRGDRTHGFHLFRHSGGRLLYELTRDVKAVQDYLAHAQIGTTADIYVEMPEEVGREATERIAEALNLETLNFPLTVPLESERIQ